MTMTSILLTLFHLMTLSNTIPGLEPTDIYLNLEKQGFITDKSYSSDGVFYTVSSDEYGIQYKVYITSKNASDVQSIRANVIVDVSKKSIGSSKQFIQYIASIPYNNADQQKAVKWVADNFYNNKASTVINGVKFTLLAPSNAARILDINPL